jgi:hypothetical protein
VRAHLVGGMPKADVQAKTALFHLELVGQVSRDPHRDRDEARCGGAGVA